MSVRDKVYDKLKSLGLTDSKENFFNYYDNNESVRKNVYNKLKDAGLTDDEQTFYGYMQNDTNKVEQPQTEKPQGGSSYNHYNIVQQRTQPYKDEYVQNRADDTQGVVQVQPQEMDEQAVMRGYLENSGQLDRLDEMKAQAEATMEKHGGEMKWWEVFIPGLNYVKGVKQFKNRFFNDEYRTAAATRDKIEEAQDLIDEAKHTDNGWLDKQVGGVLRGIADAGSRASTWDFGATGLADAYTINDIIAKQENGEQLTSSEQNLLDAMGLVSAVQSAYQDQSRV